MVSQTVSRSRVVSCHISWLPGVKLLDTGAIFVFIMLSTWVLNSTKYFLYAVQQWHSSTLGLQQDASSDTGAVLGIYDTAAGGSIGAESHVREVVI